MEGTKSKNFKWREEEQDSFLVAYFKKEKKKKKKTIYNRTRKAKPAE